MRRSIFACGLLLALAGMTTAAAAATGAGRTVRQVAGGRAAARATSIKRTTVGTHEEERAIRYWSHHVQRARVGVRHWLTVIEGRPPHGSRRSLSARSPERLRQLARAWRHREHAAWWRATHPPNLRAWLCIHEYEGSWTDSGGPYWGGLQMDSSFQQTYGGWLLRHVGTADHWTALEQIWAAVRAWRVRGFSPWPTTARYCGMA